MASNREQGTPRRDDTQRNGERTSRTGRLLYGLRVFAGSYTDLTRRFASWLDLHSTDATALVEILYAEDHGAPLSPARLADRISLSSAATTALLNRLEAAGHVVRTREHTDRRVVTLRSSPEIREPAEVYFATLTEHLDATLDRYPAEEIDLFESFLADLCSTMETVLSLPDAPSSPSPRPASRPARRS